MFASVKKKDIYTLYGKLSKYWKYNLSWKGRIFTNFCATRARRAAIGIIVLKGNKRERKNSRRIDSLNTVSFRSSFSIKMVKGLSA